MEQLQNISYTSIYWMFLLPFAMEGVDVLTGFAQAYINGTLQSTKMRDGLLRKLLMFLAIVTAFIVETALPVVSEMHLTRWVSIYIVITEVLSILENLDQAGVPIPNFAKMKLGKIKERMENDNDGESVD